MLNETLALPVVALRTGEDRRPPAGPLVRVLLAEDDEAMRAVLGQTLRAEGLEVVEVADGEALVAVARGDDRIDLIVADLHMPGRTGLEALAELRAIGCRVPAVLISAFVDETVAARARHLGVTEILSKPFGLAELRRAVSGVAATAEPLPADDSCAEPEADEAVG